MRIIIGAVLLIFSLSLKAQDSKDTVYFKKKVLETIDVDILMSYYTQSGTHAAVSGGIGDESLQDITPTLVVSVPLNEDDVLTVDAGISAYTSASSSNINPFDSRNSTSPASPYQASSGASRSDVLAHVSGSYSHSSDDRNTVSSGHVSLSNEFDYFSFGFGGGYNKSLNDKNTELGLKANVFLDNWRPQYPVEFKRLSSFKRLTSTSRNSYSLGLSYAQVISKKLQSLVNIDGIYQKGLLSTPFQRVYFADVADRYQEDFPIADDIERLPDTRFKFAIGAFINYYINDIFVLRTFTRYYQDDWNIKSWTASVEIPVKISEYFTLYPSYRFYNQTAADYFAPYNVHLSTDTYYTSDYDLSEFSANQYGFGLSYTDIFTSAHLWRFGLKSIDLKYNYYKRNSGLKAHLVSFGMKFQLD
ncbi:MAG TPA: DUF3570 domain-containing protein [Saprospiraceae bacterium]|nr:DUF3570 domain-containing protein [Saprospiraceae bacterium]MCB9327942.1 DUF3570 domain-containing protein [Lewinellaceae bacterium]HPQ20757.1 DUF3570 domain-containing protein [Saprospiraceae bacterium]